MPTPLRRPERDTSSSDTLPGSLSALLALGSDGGDTEVTVPGQRSLPPSSRALATVAQKRPGGRIY
jgi:hypothetical protein